MKKSHLLMLIALGLGGCALLVYAQDEKPKMVEVKLTLEKDTIAEAKVGDESVLKTEKNDKQETIKFIEVRRNDRIKLTCQTKDKTYKLRIKDRKATDVIVKPNETSAPLYVVFTQAKDEEIELLVGDQKVSQNLFFRVK